jgi:hypothetical protein
MFSQYIKTALWSSTDEKGEPLDKTFTIDDIAQESIDKMHNDTVNFLKKCNEEIKDFFEFFIECDTNEFMHDFWLTRNHHGAGFWDGDYPDLFGKKLTEISHSFGVCDLYIGDDGQIHIF